jgi:uncharacterized protein YndB with AHSA1/START domain
MNFITVQVTIKESVSKVWQNWTEVEHIINWNFAASDWHCPVAKNNLALGGEFHYTMAARDNSMSFDFWGTYQQIEHEKRIEIVLGDGRKMTVLFEVADAGTIVIEHFEPEQENTIELQQAGWQMILDNFKKYTEIERLQK